MPSYQYRKSHCGDETIFRSSYLHKIFPILIIWHFYIESRPRILYSNQMNIGEFCIISSHLLGTVGRNPNRRKARYDPFFLHIQYPGCSCLGDTRSQAISSHNADPIISEYSDLSTKGVIWVDGLNTWKVSIIICRQWWFIRMSTRWHCVVDITECLT